ncbi:MAG: TRAP transporter small permease subunit [Pseudomonadota bacterium]
MPDISYTLPHWLYWVGLILFPLIAMVLSRRSGTHTRRYQSSIGYMILVTGGMLGLHRFYLKSMLGFVFVPVFLFILFSNGNETDARSVVSNLANDVRVAERTIEREQSRLDEARTQLTQLRADLSEAEPGSTRERLTQRRIERAEETIPRSEERITEAQAVLSELATPLQDAQATRSFWENAAGYAFWVLVALMAIDAVLLPGLVRRANENIVEEGPSEAELALESVEAEEVKHDSDYAQNWIDRLSLFCGEFVAYWAVIAVFVYYFEVISRYVFGTPTNWAHESMYLMFGMQYLIAGSYAMLTESHVRVDIFYAPLSRPRKAWVDLLTSIFFFIFAGTLLYTSWIFAMDAMAVPTGNSVVSDWARGDLGFGEMLGAMDASQWTDENIRWGEISFNEWEVPLWPMKWVMVIGALLLILQGVSKIAKDIRAVAQGA